MSAGNYAVPGASRYQQVNTNPWMQALKNNYNDADQSEMTWSPYLGLEEFLRQTNPSTSTGATIRSMFDMMQQRHGMQNYQNMQAGVSGPRWTDYLRDFDWGREMARLPAGARKEQNKFMRPVRTVTY